MPPRATGPQPLTFETLGITAVSTSAIDASPLPRFAGSTFGVQGNSPQSSTGLWRPNGRLAVVANELGSEHSSRIYRAIAITRSTRIPAMPKRERRRVECSAVSRGRLGCVLLSSSFVWAEFYHPCGGCGTKGTDRLSNLFAERVRVRKLKWEEASCLSLGFK